MRRAGFIEKPAEGGGIEAGAFGWRVLGVEALALLNFFDDALFLECLKNALGLRMKEKPETDGQLLAGQAEQRRREIWLFRILGQTLANAEGGTVKRIRQTQIGGLACRADFAGIAVQAARYQAGGLYLISLPRVIEKDGSVLLVVFQGESLHEILLHNRHQTGHHGRENFISVARLRVRKKVQDVALIEGEKERPFGEESPSVI